LRDLQRFTMTHHSADTSGGLRTLVPWTPARSSRSRSRRSRTRGAWGDQQRQRYRRTVVIAWSMPTVHSGW